MNRPLRDLLIFSVALFWLGACAAPPPFAGPPATAEVEIIKTVGDDGCVITAQTTTVTCGFGAQDPNGQVCQEPSKGNKPRRIEWTAAEDFKLEFENNVDPFIGNALCDLNTMDQSKNCQVAQYSSSLLPSYKYAIVFSDTCKWDPYVFLRR